MDVSSLKSQIKLKTVPSFLIFAGEEWKVQEIYINQIAKAMKKEVRRIDSIADIYSSLKNKSFVQKSYVYVVRDDKELMANEKLQQQINNGLLADNILILILTTIDKRTRFFKAYNAQICVFEKLTNNLLSKYANAEINLSERNIQRLIDICESDYGRILLEIDKIKKYAEHELDAPFTQDVVHWQPNDVFEKLVEDGTIYQPPYDAIFDLVDAILDRKVNKSFDLLQQAYDIGEATLVMLTVLYNNAKAVLQVQTYQGNNLSKATGLTGFQISNAKKHVGKYSDNALIYIVELVQKIEKGIKTGKMEDEFAMQYLLCHIL